MKDLRKEFSFAFKKANTVILCPVYTAGEKIQLGFNYLNFAKQLIKYFSFEKLKNIIEENGFIIQEVNSKIILWYSHKWVIAKKNN